MPGGSLAATLNGVPKPAAEAARLVECLARAVAEAHRRGIVHGFLKPSNILLDADGHPKVADFGLMCGPVSGNPGYAAPEQVGTSDQVGPATDVYSLGTILYELLTGRRPFQAPIALETITQIMESDPIPPSRIRARFAWAIDAICLKCLAKAPNRRYATAEALADDLRRFRSEAHDLPQRTPLRQRIGKALRRTGAMAALLLVLLAIAVLLVARPREHSKPADPPVKTDRERANERVAAHDFTAARAV